MDKTKLLSIGTMSKLTGVHIKSLRYYDKISILPPAYVDPDTQYRYYSFPQIHVVDAIQLCVELDIPLKQFSEFVGSERKHIYFAKLLAKGTELAKEKIQNIQDRLDFLSEVQKEFVRGHELQNIQSSKIFHIPGKTCLTVPYEGSQNTVDYYKGINHLFGQIKQTGLKPGYDMGLLLIFKDGKSKQYIFLTVENTDQKFTELPNSFFYRRQNTVFFRLLKAILQKRPFYFLIFLNRTTIRLSWK